MLAARNALQMELDATQLDCLVIKATLRDLARRIGIRIGGPAALTRIEKGLERLGTVTLSISERGFFTPSGKLECSALTKQKARIG